jgi:tetratricopeptide (TPR) repeat protein
MMRAFAVMVALCGTASADPEATPPEPKSAVVVLFEEGRALLDAGQGKAACERFASALELEPEALGAILNLGLCNEQQDKLATALQWYRRALARASELKKEGTEETAKEKAAALAEKVATLKIVFSAPPPSGATVTLDGTPVAAVDFNRIEIDAGTHELAMTAPGITSTHDRLTIADGAKQTATIKVAAPTFVTIDRGRDRRKRAYIAGGVGAALLIGDTALTLIAKHEYDATDELASRARWKNAARYGATSMFVVGAAAIGTAIYWYLTAPGIERVEERMVVAPAVAPDHIGFAVSRSF